MAVKSIEVYPTCDIHLVLAAPTGSPTTYQLVVRDYNEGINLSGDVIKTSYSENDDAIASVSSSGLITPAAAGETFCRIRHEDMDLTDPDHPQTFVSEIVVRIRVHTRLDDFWIGNNRVTLFEGEDNYVLSVYGVFGDGTIGDISSHPYLRFASANPGKVKVNDTDDKGRLTGMSVTGDTPVEISGTFGAITRTVNAFVVPELATPRPILERIHGTGKVNERRNILFLSEGFTQPQKALFKRIATLLKDGVFTSRLHSPYDMLKDRFNVWTAFEPSPEEGVSAGDLVVTTGSGPFGTFTGEPISYTEESPNDPDNYSLGQLILHVGLPDRYQPVPPNLHEALHAWVAVTAGTEFSGAKVKEGVFKAWRQLRDAHLLQTKDTIFGFINGSRRGDRDSRQVDPAGTPAPLMHWYLADEPAHALILDRRRMSNRWSPGQLRNDYLASLRVAKTNADIIHVWVKNNDGSGGEDRTLVIFLVNSAFDGGLRSSGFGISVSARQDREYSELHIAGRQADHGVPEILPLSTFPALVGSSIDEMVSVLAHELGHTFGLGDEYEGQDYGGTHDVIERSDVPSRRSIAEDNNLVHHYSIENPAGGPGRIDMDRVKWRLWHRISQCSVLTEDPDVLPGDRLRVRVKPAERIKWQDARLNGLGVYLRTRTINADVIELPEEDTPDDERWFLEGPLQIQDVQDDGTVILSGSSVDDFETGDVLYQPLVENGEPLTVFHPDVLFDLELFGGPFAKKDDPSKANMGAAYPPERLATTAPTLTPRHAAFVVGVYEGGGTYNSRVYRPSGMCKMRKSRKARVREKPLTFDLLGTPVVGPAREVKRFVPFCYVCRYTLANNLDPTLLEGLPYPD